MFIYAFYYALSRHTKAKLLHASNNSSKYGHSAYQLPDVFVLRDIDTKYSVQDKIFALYWHGLKALPRFLRTKLLQFSGYQEVTVPDNFVYYDNVVNYDYNKRVYRGTWQSEQYFSDFCDEIKEAFLFKTKSLNEKTRSVDRIIQVQNSVSVHVRRSDYLSGVYKSGFGGICTLEYYNKAMDYISERISDAHFYVFSDDIEWCRQNFTDKSISFIDWNVRDDSWQDMYLMSHCKHNIIANSTFSWWGAYLNRNPESIIIAPSVWWNGIKDDIVPKRWTRL